MRASTSSSFSPLVPVRPRPVPRFPFVGERLWLDFVNTDDARPPLDTRRAAPPASGDGERLDALVDFDRFVDWLEAAGLLDAERALGIRRRAHQQPAGATAVLVDARRVRAALRHLAERGAQNPRTRSDALAEINRVLGRSAGTRRIEAREEGGYARTFVAVGDAFAALMIPIVESAADALIADELRRVRRCADPQCPRVFHDTTKNGTRRWCEMARCGNRAKGARFRARGPVR